jgi:predicted acetyltransferase
MSEKIVQLTIDDYEEIIEFINMVFAIQGPVNFPEILPKLYQPTDEHMRCNWAIKRNGEIRAAIGLFPMALHLGDSTLNARGIGGVSVHPDDRGKGDMQKLVRHCIHLMREEDVQLSWLSGHRQRYGYFGYEIGGIKYTFSVQADNVRHALGERSPVRFESLQRGDKERLSKIANWHERQILRVERPQAQLYEILSGWSNEPFSALNSNDEFIGYVVSGMEGNSVKELAGENTDASLDIISAWTKKQGALVTIETPPFVSSLTTALSRLCESFCTVETGNWRVFNWPAVLTAALKAKNQMTPMANGSIRIAIENHDCYELVVDGESAVCRPTFATPDIYCDEKTATALFFHSYPIDLTLSSIPKNSVLRQWLPLPLTISKQDEV